MVPYTHRVSFLSWTASMRQIIELEEGEYREVTFGPLGPAKELRRCFWLFLAGSVFSAFAAWWTGQTLCAFSVIPLAYMAGVTHTGLNPSFWFPRSARPPATDEEA
jgi:hypothetical protein